MDNINFIIKKRWYYTAVYWENGLWMNSISLKPSVGILIINNQLNVNGKFWQNTTRVF